MDVCACKDNKTIYTAQQIVAPCMHILGNAFLDHIILFMVL